MEAEGRSVIHIDLSTSLTIHSASPPSSPDMLAVLSLLPTVMSAGASRSARAPGSMPAAPGSALAQVPVAASGSTTAAPGSMLFQVPDAAPGSMPAAPGSAPAPAVAPGSVPAAPGSAPAPAAAPGSMPAAPGSAPAPAVAPGSVPAAPGSAPAPAAAPAAAPGSMPAPPGSVLAQAPATSSASAPAVSGLSPTTTNSGTPPTPPRVRIMTVAEGTLVLIPNRHPKHTQFYLVPNHPLVRPECLPSDIYVGLQDTTPAEMNAYHEWLADTPLPEGTEEGVISAGVYSKYFALAHAYHGLTGYLRLRPGDYVLLRDAYGDGNPEHDAMQIWVTST